MENLSGLLASAAGGICGAVLGTLIPQVVKDRQRRHSVITIMRAEVGAIRKRVEKLQADSTLFEAATASEPLLSSIANDAGLVEPCILIYYRECLGWYYALRKAKDEETRATTMHCFLSASERFEHEIAAQRLA